jgi:hypothetical protein
LKWLLLKISEMTSVEEDVEQRKPLQEISANIMENSMKFPQKTENELSYNQQSHFWVYMQREQAGYV